MTNMGFSNDELNDLLSYGVKPWDGDAWVRIFELIPISVDLTVSPLIFRTGFLSRIAGRLLRRDLENVLRDLHHTCKSNLTLLHSTGGYLPRSLPISKCPQTYFSPFVGSSIGGPG
ncbi:hypothetical protein M407DRAFT_190542 [Tulasnella calospora MUT 4182]|uniref:Uncharacterized protein n=1 Tax=Tulasnella calospora MUT 4182 TaxID=1051891 RepID=A0A0C3PP98_9AGAM|nr:hypothetical protein M407DRAFT_190542 [Tulasnella calospora MUT 4182]